MDATIRVPLPAPLNELPIRVPEPRFSLASARKQCIFGLSESRFPISA